MRTPKIISSIEWFVVGILLLIPISAWLFWVVLTWDKYPIVSAASFILPIVSACIGWRNK